jgi:hypothetical protein
MHLLYRNTIILFGEASNYDSGYFVFIHYISEYISSIIGQNSWNKMKSWIQKIDVGHVPYSCCFFTIHTEEISKKRDTKKRNKCFSFNKM